jgi:hypothetical protein
MLRGMIAYRTVDRIDSKGMHHGGLQRGWSSSVAKQQHLSLRAADGVASHGKLANWATRKDNIVFSASIGKLQAAECACRGPFARRFPCNINGVKGKDGENSVVSQDRQVSVKIAHGPVAMTATAAQLVVAPVGARAKIRGKAPKKGDLAERHLVADREILTRLAGSLLGLVPSMRANCRLLPFHFWPF